MSRKSEKTIKTKTRNRFDEDEQLETPFSMENLKSTFFYVKKYKKQMSGALILSGFASVIGLAGPLISKQALDVAIPNKDKNQLILLVGLLLVTIFVNIIFNGIRGILVSKSAQNIIYDIRKDLFGHLQKLSFDYYDTRPHGKILVRVVNYVNSVSNALSNGILDFIIEIINIIVIIIFMFIADAELAIVILLGLPVVGIFISLIKPIQRKAWQEISNKNSNVNAYVQESIEGHKVTQAFVRQEKNINVLDNLSMERRKAWMTGMYIGHSVPGFVEIVSQIVYSCVFIVGVYYLKPMVSFGTIMTMGTYSFRFWQPIINLANIYNTFINAIAYLERIFETINEKVDIEDKENAYELPEISGKVEFKNVNFSYDGEKQILKNINFIAKPGESIAFVGATGSGKSTIVNLISRFYNIKEGEVLIDDNNVMDVTLNSLRSQMGIMLQDSFIFTGTIADNIKYGKQNATREEIITAAKLVQADTFIKKMRNGYDTNVTERGGGLSQGEKQLIAFARVVLANPNILILDEATSSIDTNTEKLVQDGINVLLKGRTSFIIAHRLSTIKQCDKIMYISNGEILEEGTHDNLIKQKGYYYKLFMSQYKKIA